MAIYIKQTSAQGKNKLPRRPRSLLLLLVLIQLPITIFVIAFGWMLLTSFQYQGFKMQNIGPYAAISNSLEGFRAYRFPVAHWLGLAESLPIIYLDIKQENYRALEYAAQHDTAIQEGRITGDTLRREIFVKANMRLNDETLPIKIRLKGDRRLHWENPDKWSFRIEIRGERSLFGMQTFSLQKPVTRNYLYEWFFHKLLKREGIIGLRYDFIQLYVNGKSQGIYAVEEHFDKILLENNNRREAPIVRFSEYMTGDKDWFQMPVTPFNKNRWLEKDPEMLRQASNLLEDFHYGRKTIGEVFDIELLARYFAIVDLTDSFHAALAKSVRFYYNPINKKLEPIGFDAQFSDRKFPVLLQELSDFRMEEGYNIKDFYNAFFGPDINNKVVFIETYVQELERISKPEFLDELFEEIGEELEEKQDAIYAEIPWHDVWTGHLLTTGVSALFYFSKEKLYERQIFIRQRLSPVGAVTAYIEVIDDQRMVVQMANAQKLPIEILEAVHDDIVYKPAKRLLLNEKPRYEPMAFKRYELLASGPRPAPEKVKGPAKLITIKPSKTAIRYRVPGSSTSREHDLFNWRPAGMQDTAEVPYNRFMPLEARDFLAIDNASKTVAFKPGVWQITRDILIPEGYTLVGNPGTTIDLLSGSRLVSYSPLVFNGTQEDPFVITSSDKTGKGMVVLEAKTRSTLNHVRFENLALAEGEAWALSSVVTFHRSDVDIKNSYFGDNQSEDVLNIVRSNFRIDSCIFMNTMSDAFDSDFSNGRVENTQYVNIGNDAIDVSGSSIVLRHVTIEGAGDKGLSVGEASRMETEYVNIANANIGVAVKDNSYFEGMTLTIRNTNVGIALFQKKPEYGSASAALWRTTLDNVTESHWLEEGSELSWDGVPVIPNKVELKKVLYAEEQTKINAPATERPAP
jgi:hypothetical protein